MLRQLLYLYNEEESFIRERIEEDRAISHESRVALGYLSKYGPAWSPYRSSGLRRVLFVKGPRARISASEARKTLEVKGLVERSANAPSLGQVKLTPLGVCVAKNVT